MDDQSLLTVEETAKVLRISRTGAWRLVNRGELPVIRIGRLVRVPAVHLKQWIDATTRPAPSAGDRAA